MRNMKPQRGLLNECYIFVAHVKGGLKKDLVNKKI